MRFFLKTKGIWRCRKKPSFF